MEGRRGNGGGTNRNCSRWLGSGGCRPWECRCSVWSLLIAALVTYLLTTLATTAAGNIPLNNTLERFDPVNRTPAEIDAARRAYERPWNRWHDVRTVSSTAAFILCVAAAFVDVSTT